MNRDPNCEIQVRICPDSACPKKKIPRHLTEIRIDSMRESIYRFSNYYFYKKYKEFYNERKLKNFNSTCIYFAITLIFLKNKKLVIYN